MLLSGLLFLPKRYSSFFEFTNRSYVEDNFVLLVQKVGAGYCVHYKKKKKKKKTQTWVLPLPQLETFRTDKVTLLLVTSESIFLSSNTAFVKSASDLGLLCKYYHCIPVAPSGIVVLNITCDKATHDAVCSFERWKLLQFLK